MFNSTPMNNNPAKIVASIKPYFICPPNASPTRAMANGPSAAPAAVKNRKTPAIDPCFAFGKQLMPFELRVG